MAYSKAWTIMKTAEKELGFSLLVSTTGGKNGGGATLSIQAKNLLAAYEQYCYDIRNYAQREFQSRFSHILNDSSKE
jgi:molybdate transport repressor ModE-like protein